MCATELDCKNTDNIPGFLFSSLSSSQWLTAAVFQLDSDTPDSLGSQQGGPAAGITSVGSLLSASPERILLPQGLGDNFITANLLLRCGAKQNNTRLINCTNYYISRGKEKLRRHFLLSLFIDSQAGAATLVFSRAAGRRFPRHSEGADSSQHFSKHCLEIP